MTLHIVFHFLGVTSSTVCNTVRQWSVWEQNRLWCLTPGCRQAGQKPCSSNWPQPL